MKIWLDDERPAPEGWKWVKDALECVGWLLMEPVEQLSVDHDLGLSETGVERLPGYFVLEWIERELGIRGAYHRMKMVPEAITVHSANAGARKKMELAIESINRLKETERINA